MKVGDWNSPPIESMNDCFLNNIETVKKVSKEDPVTPAAILTLADAINGVGFALMNLDHPLSNKVLMERLKEVLKQD